MNNVERIEQYAYRIRMEPEPINLNNRPSKGWPKHGTIKFQDLTMRYAPGLPIVLNSVSFEIMDREKIGIVGRTGSGKSSLMQV